MLQLYACNESALIPGEKDSIKIKRDIAVTLNNYFADIREQGLKGEFQYLDSSSSFYWVPPGYATALSYDSVIAAIKRNAVMFTLVDNKWKDLKIFPLSNSLASYTATIHAHMKDTAGAIMEYNLIESGILIKRKNDWKLLSGQTAIIK